MRVHRLLEMNVELVQNGMTITNEVRQEAKIMTTIRIRKLRKKTLELVPQDKHKQAQGGPAVEVLIYGAVRAIVRITESGTATVVWTQDGYGTKPIREALVNAAVGASILSARTQSLWQGSQGGDS
jgi:hypothetical protein